jgi:AraC-like DNA-binding protein
VLSAQSVAVLSTSPTPRLEDEPTVVRRHFDQMEVVRLLSRGGRAQFALSRDAAGWPFMTVYAVSPTTLKTATGASVELGAGDCYIRRNGAPIHSIGPTDILVIQVPATAVGLYRRTLDQADGCKCSTLHGTGRLVGHVLDGLAMQLDGYHPANPAHLAHHVVGLLAMMWAETVPAEVGWSRSKMLERCKEFIELHLCDFDLTPASVAAALNMSSRNVHRLFESENITIGGWIRRRRLERSRIELSDKAFEGQSVSSIASRWGLFDAAHFSRIFKATYGLSPRAYRLAHRTTPDEGTSGFVRERLSEIA